MTKHISCLLIQPNPPARQFTKGVGDTASRMVAGPDGQGLQVLWGSSASIEVTWPRNL
jgi:hypothetical protein